MANSRAMLDANNRSPLLNIVNWIFIIISFFAVLVKCITKWTIAQSFQLDDFYMLSALIFAIGVTICVSLQAEFGLGQHMVKLSASDIVGYQKAEYAWQILYLWSLFAARMALLQMFTAWLRMQQRSWRRNVVLTVIFFNALSTFVFTIAVAFQCPVPHTWMTLAESCAGQTTLWNVYGVVDIVTDLATVIIPLYLLHDLQVPTGKKISVLAGFISRALIIPFAIARLVFLNRFDEAKDKSFDQWIVVLLTVIHMNANIILTCTPFLKPFLVSLQSGILVSDLGTLAPRAAGHRPIEFDSLHLTLSGLTASDATNGNLGPIQLRRAGIKEDIIVKPMTDIDSAHISIAVDSNVIRHDPEAHRQLSIMRN